MEKTVSFVEKLGHAVKKVAANKGSSWWHTPHMAAASRAISERIPLVDFVVEVRDARIPRSSEFEKPRTFSYSSRHIIVLNKMDLANRSQMTDWMTYFEEQNFAAYAVNSHNKENIKEFLNFLQGKVRELKMNGHSSHTTTVMLVGIPNSGKSALANSLHQIGRLSAAEKGRLKHATVSPHPGKTKDISSLKIASHPNIYVLDTPGVLPPEIIDAEVCSKLALTGAIMDCLVGELDLAQYFLAILNLNDEYKKWAKFSTTENNLLDDHITEFASGSEVDYKRKRQSPKDHTQDFIVQDVRRTLFEVISSFDGNVDKEMNLRRLIELQFIALQKALRVPPELGEDAHFRVGCKLLNLYRTGRLGHYTLDQVPWNTEQRFVT